MLQATDLIPRKSKGFTALVFAAIAIIVLSGAYCIFFSPFLLVTSITVAGAERIDSNAILTRVEKVLQEPTKSIIQKKNILFISESEITSALKKDFYSLDTVGIERIFPNAIKVTISERVPVIVWQQSNTRYYIDKKGKVIQRASIEDRLAEIPLVTNIIDTNKLPNNGSYVVHPEAIERILSVKNQLQPKIGVDAKSFTMPTGFAEEFTVQTSEGWSIIFDRKRSVISQLDALSQMLAGAIKDKRPFLHYVDLRIKNVGYFE